VSPHAATFDQALHAIVFVLGWSGGVMEVRTWREGRGEHRDFFVMDRHAGGRIVEFVRTTDERYSSEVVLGVPAVRAAGGVRAATAFWVRVEGTKQNEWLQRFKPQPTVILREGGSSRRWALWALDHPIRWTGVDKGNRRIAHRLRAPKKWAEPERLWLPAPGTCLRRGVSRPVPVVVERLEVCSFAPLDVVGRLADPPAADAWMQQRAEGSR
jgi:hypothetical protein